MREYWKGAEKLRFDDDRGEIRFVYWARDKRDPDAKWQFMVGPQPCFPIELLTIILDAIKREVWIP